VSHASELAPIIWTSPSPLPWFTGAVGPLAHRRRQPERLHHLECHHRATSSAPHHRHAAQVSPHHCFLIRRTALASLVLAPPLPLHLVRRQAWAGRTAVTTLGPPHRLGRPHCLGRWVRPDRRPWAKVRPSTVHPGIKFSRSFIFPENRLNFKNA
jgi:hypothetical protein